MATRSASAERGWADCTRLGTGAEYHASRELQHVPTTPCSHECNAGRAAAVAAPEQHRLSPMIHPAGPEQATTTGTTEGMRGDVRALRAAALYVIVIALWGMLVARIVRLGGEADVSLSHQKNVFYRLFVLHERPFLLLLIVFVGAAWWYVA